MAIVAGSFALTGCTVELQYDILKQSIENNTTTIRLYNILKVSNAQISWSRGSSWVHTYSEATPLNSYPRNIDPGYRLCYHDFEFTHNQDGTLAIAPGYGLSTTFVSGSTTAVIQLPTIPRKITTLDAPSFNDETDSLQVTLTNPANFQSIPYINFYLGNQFAVPALRLERPRAVYTSPFTWTFTEEEKEQMRLALKDDVSCNVSIGFTTYNGSTNLGYSSVQRKFSIVNAQPIFSNFDVEEVNTTIKALTGSTKNNIINVNGYSNIQATVIASNKATAQKSATMSKYRFTIGDKNVDINYSDSENVSGTVNGSGSGIYTLFAIDSRGNTTSVQKLATEEKNYSKIALNKTSCKVERDDNQVGENAVLTLSGNYWNQSFGQTTNDVVTVSYKLKKTGSESWIDGTTTMRVEKDGSSFTYHGLIASDNASTKWDLDSSYNVQITVSDYLTSDTVELILNSAIPTLSLDKQGVGIMCAYDSQLGGYLQVNGKVVGEDIYSTNEIKINKVWIDGTQIYRKVLSFTTSSTINSFVNQPHGITNVDTFLPNISFAIKYNNNWYNTPNDITIETYVNNTNFSYYNKSQYMASKPAYVILEYTKSS